MLDTLFTNLFSSDTTGTIGIEGFLTATACALVLGLVMALAYMYKNRYSKSFAVTLATLPAIVSAVIMMVSGSLGASVAVAGTFSLVRFRSAQGTAKEISAVFLAMAAGLACGMGYPVYGVIFTVIMCAVNLIYTASGFGGKKDMELRRRLTITVPEDLDYGSVFDDIMDKYTSEWKLIKAKTTNLGSLNRLTYDIVFREKGSEKPMTDELRTRNGNLEICMSIQDADPAFEL